MKLTPSQTDAVSHRGSNLLVAASAGSGKTEVLARRCVELIADRRAPCPIERLAVVTFTRAAAAELRERIARMLRTRAAEETDPGLRRHLLVQELLVDTAEIGTIDGWCGRIVRENFAAAGVDAQFAILPGEDVTLLRATVLDELFEWIYRDTAAVAQQARDWLAALPAPDDRSVRELVVALNRYREHLLDPVAWLAQQRNLHADGAHASKQAEVLLTAALRDEIEFQRHELAESLAAGQAASKKVNAYRAALDLWSNALRDGAAVKAVVDAIATLKLPNHNRKAEGEPTPFMLEVIDGWYKQRLKERFAADRIDTLLRHAPRAAQRTATLIDIEQLYEERLQRAKSQRSACEFGDVLRKTLDLLGTSTGEDTPRTPTAIAQRLRARYDHVLIDEFQDTSPMQVEILRLLTRDAPGSTNRFMVGDVKQSIYAFRQAEPRLFGALTRELDAGRAEGRLVYLSDNFRSHPAVLAPLNELFAAVFHFSLGGTEYGAPERLVARRAELANPRLDESPRVELVIIEKDQKRPVRDDGTDGDEAASADGSGHADTEAATFAGGENAERNGPAGEDAEELEQIECEALHAARRIRALLAGGTLVPERQGESMQLRPARPGDVVVLLRSAAKNAGFVARRLRAFGLPAITGGRESVLDTIEGLDIRTILALLANQRQDLALAAYLRGPLVGLSEVDLLEIRKIADGPFHGAVRLYCTAGGNPNLRARLAAAFAQLDEWTLAARDMELPALLRKILRDSGYELFVRALPGGTHRAATLDALLAHAEQFSAAGNQGAAEFAQHLEALAEHDVEPAAAIAAEEDAIRVVTIHASKGLEFPFVFLLNAGARFNERSQASPFQADREIGLGIRTAEYPLRAVVTSAAHFALTKRAREERLSEELRLLYVATTRARERLWIVGHTKEGRWSEIRDQFGGRPLPLITRLRARSMMDWILMGAASRGLADGKAEPLAAITVTCCPAGEITGDAAPAPTAQSSSGEGAPLTSDQDAAIDATAAQDTAPDADWIRQSLQFLNAAPDSRLAALPAVLSVSALKDAARRERDADAPAYIGEHLAILSRPQFASSPALDTDGRALGTATHRFLEFADLRRIASPGEIYAQRDDLLERKLLTPAEAALLPVDDLAWFGGNPEGRHLAANAAKCRRELPFVQAVRAPALAAPRLAPPQIVRGVVDCVIVEDDGLTVLDYKTDRVGDEAALQERIEAYGIQLGHYAVATAAVLGKPVKRALLIFLRARRIVTVL